MLAGLTVIVSGVGPGLGREITVAALREGAQVMMAARTESRLRATADEVDPTGRQVGWHAVPATRRRGVSGVLDNVDAGLADR